MDDPDCVALWGLALFFWVLCSLGGFSAIKDFIRQQRLGEERMRYQITIDDGHKTLNPQNMCPPELFHKLASVMLGAAMNELGRGNYGAGVGVVGESGPISGKVELLPYPEEETPSDEDQCDECGGTRYPEEVHEEHCSLYMYPEEVTDKRPGISHLPATEVEPRLLTKGEMKLWDGFMPVYSKIADIHAWFEAGGRRVLIGCDSWPTPRLGVAAHLDYNDPELIILTKESVWVFANAYLTESCEHLVGLETLAPKPKKIEEWACPEGYVKVTCPELVTHLRDNKCSQAWVVRRDGGGPQRVTLDDRGVKPMTECTKDMVGEYWRNDVSYALIAMELPKPSDKTSLIVKFTEAFRTGSELRGYLLSDLDPEISWGEGEKPFPAYRILAVTLEGTVLLHPDDNNGDQSPMAISEMYGLHLVMIPF